MAQFSFDIVSTYDKAEMNNAFMAAQKEITNRYDFRGTPAALEWIGDKAGVKVTGVSTWQVEAIADLFIMKLAQRNLTSSVLDRSQDIVESNLKAHQEIPFKEGLDQENAKRITKYVKDDYPKVKTQIQGDSVRVSSSSKDELQACMRGLSILELGIPLSYINFR